MYSVLFLKGSKVVLERDFETEQKAKDFISEQVPDYPYEYQIYDKTNNVIIDEDELDFEPDQGGISMDNLFPDDEAKEGFDVDDFFERD